MRKLFFSFLLALLMPMTAGAQEMYAVYDGVETFTFYYDNERASRSGMVYDVKPNLNGKSQWFLADWRENVKKVVFDASFADAKPKSTSYWFRELWYLEKIDGIEYLNTSEVTNMSYMFAYCPYLTGLDVSGFKTDKVTDMRMMFHVCRSLTNLDVSGFKTGNVTDMNSMFGSCSGLTNLDVTGFKTDNVTDMGGMFSDCPGLTSLDVTGFKTDNVTNMNSMFNRCSSLTSLDVTGFKTDNVTDMCGMFYECYGLTSLDVTGFKTDNVKDMSYMFNCCFNLTSLDVTGFKTDNVTNMCCMFNASSGLTSLDLSSFKTDNVTDMEYMFSWCSGLATIYVGDGWSTAGVQKSGKMFSDCTNLVGGAGTLYDENHTDHTYARIDGGSGNPGYFTAKEEGDGISTVKAAADKVIWYDMNGRKLQDKPAMKGVYIQNGKKVVIK